MHNQSIFLCKTEAKSMKTSDFYYELPQELIAQTPAEPRDHSRLMCVDRKTGAVAHRHFYDIVDLLEAGDLLVVNDSKVLPARLYGTKEDTGASVEFLLLQQKENDCWEVLVKPGRRLREGARVRFGGGLLQAEIVKVMPDGNRLARFFCEGSIFSVLEKIGEMPLPHYITQKLADKDRYQTVYARELGSAAAPTAGLHFTPELMDRLRAKGVNFGYVTLHVGLGTFRPVKAEEITDHHMHAEHYDLPQETAALIHRTKAAGKRVIAVGTTSCRTLESVAAFHDGKITAAEGYTDIFIYPGYRFQVLDGLITNFHLPESTLIMLVSAFMGYEHTMEAYRIAVEEKYRFYSFGDAMLIL